MENSDNVSKNGHLVVPASDKIVPRYDIGSVQDTRKSLESVNRLVKAGSPAFFPVPQRPETPRSLSRAGTPLLETIIEDTGTDSPSI